MSSSAQVLPRRRATLVTLSPMRPEAPTVRVSEPSSIGFESTIAFEGNLARLEHAPGDDYEVFDDRTERREPSEAEEVSVTDVEVITSAPDSSMAETLRVRLQPVEPPASSAPTPRLTLSRSGVTPKVLLPVVNLIEAGDTDVTVPGKEAVTEVAPHSRVVASVPSAAPATMPLVRRLGADIADVVIPPPPPKKVRPEPDLVDVLPPLQVETARLDRGARFEDQTRVGAPRIPTPGTPMPVVTRSGVVPALALAATYGPFPAPPPPAPVTAFAAMPAGFVPAMTSPPTFGAHTPKVVLAPDLTPAPAIPVPPVTKRRSPPRKSRGATFVCGAIAAAMAVVAVAESPLGDRPELAPHARVVRQQARGAAVGIRHVTLAAWAKIQAR